jgi:hypothetical protein
MEGINEEEISPNEKVYKPLHIFQSQLLAEQGIVCDQVAF